METKEEKKPQFVIPECRMGDFEKKFRRLQRKADKCGVERPTFTVLEKVKRKFYPPEEREVHPINRSWFELMCNVVEVEGAAPKLNGWSFVGSIEHNETGNIIRTTPLFPEELSTEDFRYTKTTCDHCKTRRFRKETFLVRNEETNELLQIGRSCLKDFTGHRAPEFYAAMCQWLIEAEEEDEERSCFFSREDVVFNIEEVLACASMWIVKFGYVSKSSGKPKITSGWVTDWFWMDDSKWEKEHNEPKPQPSDRDKEVAKKTLEFIKGLEKKTYLNDFEFNMVASARKENVTMNDMGLISYMVEHYNRHILKMNTIRKQQKEDLKSDYFGEVKQRYNLKLTFQRCFHFGICDYSGQSIGLYKFVDDKGNIFCWKTTKALDLYRGDIVELRGTVKDHSDYKGIKQTHLTRCQIKSVTNPKEGDSGEACVQDQQ